MAMNAPSYQALVPRLVKREDLTNAIALNSAQFNMSRILGPTLGGYAMALLGVAGNFFLNGVSFLAVLWALMRIRVSRRRTESPPEHVGQPARGFAYLRSNRQMLRADLDDSLCELSSDSLSHVYSVLCEGAAACGRKRAGLADGCSGLGAVLGAMTVAISRA